MRTLLLSTLAIAAIGTATAAEPPTVKKGKWTSKSDLTMTVTQNGQSQNFPVPSQSDSMCLAEDKVYNPDDFLDDGCTSSNVKYTSNSVSMNISCTANGATMSGSIDFKIADDGNSTSGTMELSGAQGPATMKISGKITSTREDSDCAE